MAATTNTSLRFLELALDTDGLNRLSDHLKSETEEIDLEISMRNAISNVNLPALLVLLKHLRSPAPSFVVTFLARILTSNELHEEDLCLLRELFDQCEIG